MDLSRRNAVKNLGVALVGSTVPASVVAGKDNGQQQTDEVIYSSKRGRIVQVGPYSYLIQGATTKEDYEFLRDKVEELTHSANSGDFSTQTHSDQGYDEASGTYEGVGWDIQSDFWASADNGTLKTEGSTDANWWVDGYWNDGTNIDARITINLTVTASFNVNSASVTVSVPPGGTWAVSNDKSEATLTDQFEWGTHHPTVSYSKGTLVWEADCFNWAAQDTSVKFEFDDGTTQFHGTYIKAGVGHCAV